MISIVVKDNEEKIDETDDFIRTTSRELVDSRISIKSTSTREVNVDA